MQAPSVSADFGTPFTLALKFSLPALAGSQFALATFDVAQGHKGMRLDITSSSKAASFRLFVDASNYLSVTLANLKIGENTVVVTSDGTRLASGITMYVNGSKVVGGTISGDIATGSCNSAKPLVLGGYWNGAALVLSSQYYVYTRLAYFENKKLTANEVNNLLYLLSL
jgi:hypothetical protein